MPPLDERTKWIEPRFFASARAMSFDDCSRLHRSQSSFFSEADSFGRRFCVICTISWVMS